MAAPLDIDGDLQRMVLRKGEATPVTDTFPTPLDDIDLSVLGSPAERFERDDQDVDQRMAKRGAWCHGRNAITMPPAWRARRPRMP